MADLAKIIAGLALGATGGAAFYWLSLPLPWMLGALFVTMVASISGAPILGPVRLRPAIIAVIGVLLGSRFTPEVLDQAGQTLVTLSILLVYLAAVGAVVVPYYRIIGRQDWITAYFSGMPGGLSEMVELGEAKGADGSAIVLAHSLRIVLTMVASISGAPILGPVRLRPAIIAVIGVLLGSRFTPEVLDQAGQTLVTLSILLAYLAAVGAVVVPYYRIIGRQDWITAYFSGMPGGLSEMVELGEAKGADGSAIVLAHSLRIVLTIGVMAILFRVVLAHGVLPRGSGAAMGALGAKDAGLLAGCAVLGALAGPRLRLPAPTFLGPLILSAAVHLTGLTQSLPPSALVIAAQVALGTVLGCRFQGIPLASLARAGALSLGATVLTLVLAAGAGLLMQATVGVGLDQALLALAPGGLTEMGLMALAIHADVAFVALHHIVRILVVIVGAPLVLRAFAPKG